MDAILDKVNSVMDPVKKVTFISRCKYVIIIIFLIEAATLVNMEPELIQPVLADPTVFFFIICDGILHSINMFMV